VSDAETTGSGDWWLGLAPAEAALECAGETHHVRWGAGELRALDHDDPDGERALAALGGGPCQCVDLLDAWRRHERDIRVLALASRGPGDILPAGGGPAAPGQLLRGASGQAPPSMGPLAPTVLPGQPASGRPTSWISPVPLGYGFAQSANASSLSISVAPRVAPRGAPGRALRRPPGGGPPGGAAPEAELIGLLSLGGGLPDRLQASVIAAWTQRVDERDEAAVGAAARLHAALYGRLLGGLRSWLGRLDLELDLEIVDAQAPRSLTRAESGRLRAKLPLRWLTDVWSRGLTSVIGRFCLDAATTDGREWTLITLGPELGRPETVTLRLPRAGN
jgi:hypothetical protein